MFALKFDRGNILYLGGNIYRCDSQWKGFLVICVQGERISLDTSARVKVSIAYGPGSSLSLALVSWQYGSLVI